LIKLNDLKIKKTEQNATDIFFKFGDTKITLEQHEFLKSRLENYKKYIPNEYSIELELEHQYHIEELIINLILKIPEHVMTDDLSEYTEIIMDQINVFRNFYDSQNIIFKNKY
jgi:hypothetical protein